MKSAEFSPCRQYRYTLWREWLFGTGYINFVCLNPSTADETRDDNTIRKCVKFAKTWGYQAMCVTNLFAIRSTDPKVMLKHPEPVGAENDSHLRLSAYNAELVIAAWGRHGRHLNRSFYVRRLLNRKLHILRMGEFEPWHPLYLPDSTQPIEWRNQ